MRLRYHYRQVLQPVRDRGALALLILFFSTSSVPSIPLSELSLDKQQRTYQQGSLNAYMVVLCRVIYEVGTGWVRIGS